MMRPHIDLSEGPVLLQLGAACVLVVKGQHGPIIGMECTSMPAARNEVFSANTLGLITDAELAVLLALIQLSGLPSHGERDVRSFGLFSAVVYHCMWPDAPEQALVTYLDRARGALKERFNMGAFLNCWLHSPLRMHELRRLQDVEDGELVTESVMAEVVDSDDPDEWPERRPTRMPFDRCVAVTHSEQGTDVLFVVPVEEGSFFITVEATSKQTARAMIQQMLESDEIDNEDAARLNSIIDSLSMASDNEREQDVGTLFARTYRRLGLTRMDMLVQVLSISDDELPSFVLNEVVRLWTLAEVEERKGLELVFHEEPPTEPDMNSMEFLLALASGGACDA